MASRRQLRRQFQIEGLEKRDTPSALSGVAAEIHMEKAKPKPPPKPKYKFTAAPIIGSGTVLLGTLEPTSASGTMSGTITVPKKNAFHASFGAFTGNLTVNLVGQGQATAIGQFNLKGGALVMSFTLAGSLQQGSFSGTFTVAGGTGKFAHTTGVGTVTAVLNASTESAALNLAGNLKIGVQVK
jgi:hypothetical protein